MTPSPAAQLAPTPSAREAVAALEPTPRILALKERMLDEPRYLSIEQALIITDVYQAHEGDTVPVKRALSLAEAMRRLDIRIDPDELIVGNRTTGVRAGVVFPEAGISWIDHELDTLPTRPQDKFNVQPEDVATFRERILPYWQGKTLEDTLRAEDGPLLDAIARVVKINQKDHAQGHICPDTAKWIRLGPAGLRRRGGRAAGVRGARPARVLRVRAHRPRRVDGLHAPLRGPGDLHGRGRPAGARRQPPRGRPDLHQALPRWCRDLPRGGPVALVPVRPAPPREQRLVLLAGPGRPVPLPLPRGRPRGRPAGPGRRARADRGALAQVQPDRLPAELAQRVLLRGLPDRLQRRLRRPGRARPRRVQRPLATSSSRPRTTSSCRSPTCPPASTRTRRTRCSTSAPG